LQTNTYKEGPMTQNACFFKWFRLLVALTLSFCPVSGALAGGFIIPHQTARGVALSNALIAGIDDASATYYNPGALGEISGNNLMVNGVYINAVSSVENSGRRAVNKRDDNLIASLFANYHIPGTDFTIGIGAYSPFGLATTYERDFTRFAANRTELKTIFVTPSLAWHPSRYFSVGAGLSYVHASGLFSRALCLDAFAIDSGCATPGGPFEGKIRITDTANAFTYNLGLLVKPTDTIKLGLTYRGRTDIRFDSADAKLGENFTPSKVKADVRPVALPPLVNAGVFWQMNPQWSAEFVYEFTRWSEFRNFSASLSPVPGFNPLGGLPIASFSLPQNWKDTSTLRFGGSYQATPNWVLRGGLALEETPIPSNTLNPAIPGADILTLNAGVSYQWEKFTIDFGYMAVFYKTRKVTNGELEGLPATGIPFSGAPGRDKYRTFNNFVAAAVNYRF
jgi:long-chain fatty acid transport protein